MIGNGEQKLKKNLPDLRFRINKERLQMYINIKNTPVGISTNVSFPSSTLRITAS